MPGRPFIPAALPTDSLRGLVAKLDRECHELTLDYNQRSNYWDTLIRRDAPQYEIDMAEYATKNARRRETRAFNKKRKVIEEIMNRDMLNQRENEMAIRVR
jgi:hypothetical protein